ncbi:MAG TPA: acetyl-CoA carboxylase biotin carboxyl carrier protein, partial [Verrucomicrobiae bacterium]|nr:acetyl-CoA carboxylase biotin carboxyl carrier protein [Verrucomicrobiae bacterium]
SQLVGTQAVLNVLSGARYKLIPGEVKAYVKGLYGLSPAPIDEEIKTKIIGEETQVSCRPADLLQPSLEKCAREVGNLAKNMEDVLSYALFPQVAIKFFESRENTAKVYAAATVPVNSKEDPKMNLQEIKELIKMLDETEISELNLESEGVKISIKKGGNAPLTAAVVPVSAPAAVSPVAVVAEARSVEPAPAAANPNLVPVTAPMVGTFYRSPSPDAASFVEVGSSVKLGQPVCIIEAMKLMNEIESEVSGRVVEVLVENGQPVEYGQTLFLIEKQ